MKTQELVQLGQALLFSLNGMVPSFPVIRPDVGQPPSEHIPDGKPYYRLEDISGHVQRWEEEGKDVVAELNKVWWTP